MNHTVVNQPLAAAIQRPSKPSPERKAIGVQVFRLHEKTRVAFEIDDELVGRLVQHGLLDAASAEHDETLAGALHELLYRVAEHEIVDFPKLIAELRAWYLDRDGRALSDYKLARIVTKRLGRPVHWRSIARIDAGATPKHDIGEALQALHNKVLGTKGPRA